MLNDLRLEHDFDEIFPVDAVVGPVATGFVFTEGPIWFAEGFLLFSDIPRNVIHKWTPTGKTSVFLRESGYNGPRTAEGGHLGSNGLTIDGEGRLVICEHGNRRVSRFDGEARTIVAERFEGNRLNSPNDVAPRSDGSLYFTDPPYGLMRRDRDPAKELAFNGIYGVAKGEVQLLSTALTRPNGLAFSPDERLLYVANSDPERNIWLRFEVKSDGSLCAPDIFFDATSIDEPGVPDGMKVDQCGNLYCTGQDGI